MKESLGIAVLKSRGFFSDAYWYWLGVGAVIGFMFLFNIGFILALTLLNGEYLYLVHTKNFVLE